MESSVHGRLRANQRVCGGITHQCRESRGPVNRSATESRSIPIFGMRPRGIRLQYLRDAPGRVTAVPQPIFKASNTTHRCTGTHPQSCSIRACRERCPKKRNVTAPSTTAGGSKSSTQSPCASRTGCGSCSAAANARSADEQVSERSQRPCTRDHLASLPGASRGPWRAPAPLAGPPWGVEDAGARPARPSRPLEALRSTPSAAALPFDTDSRISGADPLHAA